MSPQPDRPRRADAVPPAPDLLSAFPGVPEPPQHAVPPSALRGFLYAFAATVILSLTTYIFAKYAMHPRRGFNAATFALLWTASASVYLLVAIVARGQVRQLWLPRSAVWHLLAAGGLGGVTHILFWSGLARLDPSFTSFLMRFSPLLVVLLSVAFLGERLTGFEGIAVVVMVGGGAFSCLADWGTVGAGAVLVLLACVVSAVWRVLVKARSHHVHPVVMNFYRVALSVVVIAAWAVAGGRLRFDAAADRWGALLLGALFGPCLAVSLMFNSYRYWGLSRSSMVVMIQPLVVLAATLLLPAGWVPERTLTARQLVGGLVVLAGGLGLVWMHGRRRRAASV